MEVVKLTQVNEKREVHLNDFGLINQMIFATVSDALYHIFITNPENSTISINKTSDKFAWITIESSTENENEYFELHIVEPLSFDKMNKI